MLQTAFGAFCINQTSVFEWHKKYKKGRDSVRDDERYARSKEVNIPELIGQRVRVTMLRFSGSTGRDSVGRSQHSSNWVYGISCRTMHQSTTPSLSQTIWPRRASRQFFSLPIDQTLLPVTFAYSLSSEGRYETIEERKEAVTKVIHTLTQEEFHEALQELLERYKCIAAGGDYIEGDLSFMCVLSIKVPRRKQSENQFNVPRIYIYIYIYIHEVGDSWSNHFIDERLVVTKRHRLCVNDLQT